jgi:DNA-binding transcriptional MocR family regulator
VLENPYMPVAWQQFYAKRTEGMRASDIREILKVTAQPEIISLAGGLPAPELFPIDEYRRAFEWVLETDGAQALQYGPSEGFRKLRALLAERLERFGIQCSADDVLITNGSQQALDLIAKMLLDPGDAVLVSRLSTSTSRPTRSSRWTKTACRSTRSSACYRSEAVRASNSSTRCPISRIPPVAR